MERTLRRREGMPSLRYLSCSVLILLLVVLRSTRCEDRAPNLQGIVWTSQGPCIDCKVTTCPDDLCLLSAPRAISIGSHNITLTWQPLNKSNVMYTLLWTNLSQSQYWTHRENVSKPPFTVEELQPYTPYKFKIWALVSLQYISSPESDWYQTEAYGKPSSPPIIKEVEKTSDSVEVSWSAPERPAGPIVGYNLNLESREDVISITTGGNVFFATLFPTLPNVTYRISVAAVNREGQGPSAEVNITTPTRPEMNGEHWVFLSRMDSLRKKSEENDFFTSADCLPVEQIKSNITGVALHVSSNEVYFSEGSNIWRKGAKNLTDPSDLVHFHTVKQEVTALSVDWLYKKLYYVSDKKVYYCELEGCAPMVLNISLPSSPLRITADPYNGWLFMLLDDGIYRIPLPEVLTAMNNLTHVVKTNSLHDFVVSFSNKRLIFLNETNKKLFTVFLDGSSPVTLLSDINYKALSLAYEDGIFLLTNGESVYKRDEKRRTTFFVAFIVDCDYPTPIFGGFNNLHLFSSNSQPYPVPKSPRDLQVLFGSTSATLQWNKPDQNFGASPSAWQNWNYTVQYLENGSVVETFTNINSTQATLTGLRSLTAYQITVCAHSPAGHSSSVSFQGKTLQFVDEAPYVVAASDNSFWKQELNSFDFLEQLASNVKNVRDMDWYNGTIYWTNSSGYIFWMELDGIQSGLNTVPIHGEAVAFDWLGQRLYWSCNSSWICRGSTFFQDVEVFMQGRSKINSLLIDSISAAIYWTTEDSVESAGLDGEHHQVLVQLSFLSGQKVAGITIDVSGGSLYWVIQDGPHLNLHIADTSSIRMKNWKVSKIVQWSFSELSNHQLAYYSGRLIWLDADKKLRIQQVNQTSSVILSPNNEMTAFSLLQKTLKPWPDGFELPPVVLPHAVSKTSIHLEGNITFLQITWAPTTNVNFGSVFYCVESEVLPQSTTQKEGNCVTYCHPSNVLSEPVLRVRQFHPNMHFNISITPFTSWGKGETTSKDLRTPSLHDSNANKTLVIILSVVAGVLTAVIVVLLIIYSCRRKTVKEPMPPQSSIQMSPQGPDEELERVRGMVGLQNACYAISELPAHAKLESLPVFPRDCLKLQRLLGSGAFGEVYEGIATGSPLCEVTPKERVAVKTLRKGADDYEKIEFLKEAQIMSQFDHPNILRLLGVCLMNEPQYLILELMEGGDLRSYLRGARPTAHHGELLKLTSLLDICFDVAKGCSYLEKIHFVHRDLAARNCLVSVRGYTDPDRIVKIGDFGLARDIYKNDYYRKRGEGLLPVRWMSPESLTDGIFNKYSDVWSFGVLLWEIVTLGKQPYPALTNHEVMHHINSGRRLLAPAGCPQSLYSIMLDCWKTEPSERPNFRDLQETLRLLRESEAQQIQSQDTSEGHVNLGYQDDEEECSQVDEDEGLGEGLSPVLSEEGLNYLMFQVNASDADSDSTDFLKPEELEDHTPSLVTMDEQNTLNLVP